MPAAVQSPASESVLTLLKETFEGPSGPSTYYIDNDPRAGFLAALDALTPEQASASPWPGAPSIAGHALHAAFHVETSNAWLKGDRENRDWSRSWAVRNVDAAAWKNVRGELRRRYEELALTIERQPASATEAELTTVIAAVAHAAYHLGAIRQRVAAAAAAAKGAAPIA